MRLISYKAEGGSRLGIVARDRAVAADDLLPDGPRTMDQLLHAGPDILERLRAAADTAEIQSRGRPITEFTLTAPVPRPGKVVAIGRNYPSHAAEEDAPAPSSPLIFGKWSSCVIGHGEEIRWDPTLTSQVDYEAELGVVIGRTTRRVAEAQALEHVLGYTCVNDVSARDLQFGDGQWTRGKSLDSFCPIGPVIVTADEIPDPNDLALSCSVNGEQLQSARTSEMFFGVARIISHCSQAFTLEPGDVIATGTPAGVGAFRKPPRYLRDGDTVTISVEGIGDLVNVCRFESGQEAGRA
jgi:2-keto-4-pentenoate hydratase/2-oxohepta-3-ene-1,7-dioic acid hydratase in catechol pathway